MSPFLSRLSSASLLLALTLAMPLAAQQKVCLSVHNGPATGTNSLGQPAQLAARIEGVQVSVPTAAGLSCAALFETSRAIPGETCKLTGPRDLAWRDEFFSLAS